MTIKKCPFCGGKARITSRQVKFIGENEFGEKKIIKSVYVVCNKCYSRGKPVKFEFETANHIYSRKVQIPADIENKAIQFWNIRNSEVEE